MRIYSDFTSDKEKKKTLKYAIFGGWFGLHQYYVGNFFKGIIYTFTLGICGIGWFIDIIFILLGSFKDSTGTELKI